MKSLKLSQMEAITGADWVNDIIVGAACGSTILLLATPAAAGALITGNVCVVGLIGYGLGKY